MQVYWHQDAPFWGFSPPNALVVWFAIDDSDVENGCMQVVPATHTCSRIPDTVIASESEYPILPTQEELQTAVPILLKAGQASIHHSQIIHGSEKNLSTRRRCGLTLRYVPDGAIQTRPSARGDYFELVKIPPPPSNS